MFLVKRSKVKIGGKGVFVGPHYLFIPAGTAFPFSGYYSKRPSLDIDERRYQIKVAKNSYFIGDVDYSKGKPWANWVNRPMASKIDKTTLSSVLTQNCTQDMTKPNAKLIVSRGQPYIRTLVDLYKGTEVLYCYGGGYRIVN
jgi:hypothetical protein